MTDKTYEQVSAEHWPTDRLPVDDGERCPPFHATLFRLAEAIARNSPLTREFQELNEHLNDCGACRSTVSETVSLLNSMSMESPREVIDHVTFEGTPLRRLRDCAKALTLETPPSVRAVFDILCQRATLTTAEAFDAVGFFDEELDGEGGICLLRDLGVKESLLKRLEKPVVKVKNADEVFRKDSKVVPLKVAGKPAGAPNEPE